MSYAILCALLWAMGGTQCPDVGEPIPEPLVRTILNAGGWPAEYHDMGIRIVFQETYHHTDSDGTRYAYPWAEPDEGRFINGARGDCNSGPCMALGMWQIHHTPWHEYCKFTGDPFDPVQQTALAACVLEHDIGFNRPGWQWGINP